MRNFSAFTPLYVPSHPHSLKTTIITYLMIDYQTCPKVQYIRISSDYVVGGRWGDVRSLFHPPTQQERSTMLVHTDELRSDRDESCSQDVTRLRCSERESWPTTISGCTMYTPSVMTRHVNCSRWNVFTSVILKLFIYKYLYYLSCFINKFVDDK